MKLILQHNGNLELLCGSQSIWSSNTYDISIDGLHFSSAGKLLIYRKDKSIVKNLLTVFQSTARAETLILQDDGNLVLYNDNNIGIWSTDTYGKCITGNNIRIGCGDRATSKLELCAVILGG